MKKQLKYFRPKDPGPPVPYPGDEKKVDKKCTCGQQASVKMVRKEGPNKGKYFFGCSKELDDPKRCNFFEWYNGRN